MADYARAMQLQTEAEAEAWLDEAVHADKSEDLTVAQKRRQYRVAAAYYSAYYGRDTQERVERLFRAVHPILGPVDDPVQFDTAELMAVGYAMASPAGFDQLKPKLRAKIRQKQKRIPRWNRLPLTRLLQLFRSSLVTSTGSTN